MEIHPEIITDNPINNSIELSVRARRQKPNLFIIHPVGQINTITYPILKNELEWIFGLRPEIIMIDMKQVNYINFRGLRVILKTIKRINQDNGKFYLRNLQPDVKRMFEIVLEALPKRAFGSRLKLENYLDLTRSDLK